MTNQHRIVSSESEQLILVDEQDNEIGYRSKAECHDGEGTLHRAFSLFLFNPAGELLLQQRAAGKRLWPGYWSNSICSHPRRGETLEVATSRRLSDELNVSADIEHVYFFCYQAEYGVAGSECELCHVYLGRLHGDVQPNDSEIDAVKFVRPAEIDQQLSERPDEFTPWFKAEWQALTTRFRESLNRYAM